MSDLSKQRFVRSGCHLDRNRPGENRLRNDNNDEGGGRGIEVPASRLRFHIRTAADSRRRIRVEPLDADLRKRPGLGRWRRVVVSALGRRPGIGGGAGEVVVQRVCAPGQGGGAAAVVCAGTMLVSAPSVSTMASPPACAVPKALLVTSEVRV